MMKSKLLLLAGFLGVVLMSFGQSLKERAMGTDKIYIKFPEGRKLLKVWLEERSHVFKDPYPDKKNAKIGEKYADPSFLGNPSFLVDEIPLEDLQWANSQIQERCREYFGIEEIRTWPGDLYTKYGDPDHKSIDTEFYIIVDIWDIIVCKYKEGVLKCGFSGQGSAPTIRLFEKTKAGKRGKAVVKVRVNPVPELMRTIEVEMDEVTVPAELATSAKDIIANFRPAITQMIDEFFKEIDTGD